MIAFATKRAGTIWRRIGDTIAVHDDQRVRIGAGSVKASAVVGGTRKKNAGTTDRCA